ncbi:hypothetical protein G9A89_020876 [Geosiphon pyriformis]|nr:hypothetical protein G9A89_020876 [Geosiphon pyriformis]
MKPTPPISLKSCCIIFFCFFFFNDLKVQATPITPQTKKRNEPWNGMFTYSLDEKNFFEIVKNFGKSISKNFIKRQYKFPNEDGESDLSWSSASDFESDYQAPNEIENENENEKLKSSPILDDQIFPVSSTDLTALNSNSNSIQPFLPAYPDTNSGNSDIRESQFQISGKPGYLLADDSDDVSNQYIQFLILQNYFAESTLRKKLDDPNLLKAFARHAKYAKAPLCNTDPKTVYQDSDIIVVFGINRDMSELIFSFSSDKFESEDVFFAKLDQVEYDPETGQQVHQVLLEEFTKVEGEFTSQARSLIELNPKFNIIFTGFSWGAAYAVLAALLIQRTIPNADIKVTTFGAPRFGDKKFTDMVDQTLKTSRITYANDIIPHNPPQNMNYHHHGLEFWIASKDGPVFYCPVSKEDSSFTGESVACSNIIDAVDYVSHKGPYFTHMMSSSTCSYKPYIEGNDLDNST